MGHYCTIGKQSFCIRSGNCKNCITLSPIFEILFSFCTSKKATNSSTQNHYGCKAVSASVASLFHLNDIIVSNKCVREAAAFLNWASGRLFELVQLTGINKVNIGTTTAARRPAAFLNLATGINKWVTIFGRLKTTTASKRPPF